MRLALHSDAGGTSVSHDTEWAAFAAPGTVRSWASRHHLQRRGTSPDGRTLYDIDEALGLAEQLSQPEEDEDT